MFLICYFDTIVNIKLIGFIHCCLLRYLKRMIKMLMSCIKVEVNYEDVFSTKGQGYRKIWKENSERTCLYLSLV